MNKKIKTGIIGVSTERGWAALAHIPALKAVPDFTLTAISSRNTEKAAAAGKVFGVPHIYHSTRELVNSPEVDLVVVTVKVPQHRELVTEAINAGKDVFCEWPLGNGLQEAEELVALARKHQVKGFVGLQSRVTPAVNYIKDLVADGYIGEVFSTSVIGAGILYGAFVDSATAYALDAKNGAGMISSTFSNTVDAICYALGEFRELNATATTRRKEATIIDTGEMVPMDVHDQVAVNGTLQGGAVATIHFRGGLFKGTNFHWEINGAKGDLLITAAGGHPGVYELTIRGSQGTGELETLPTPAAYYKVEKNAVQGHAYAVAANYYNIARDYENGTHLSATFEDALVRHRMIQAIETAAATGTRQSYNNASITK